eukprot:GFYU01001957.1.p1 GENE.GFYU01001957.1~~GFYU01001957.1.p1  ORF type:complete len:189 (-),score=54.28 GFYU01001957.1:18-584(-)
MSDADVIKMAEDTAMQQGQAADFPTYYYVLAGVLLYFTIRQVYAIIKDRILPQEKPYVAPPKPDPRPFTLSDLKPFTGENGSPVYFAVDGVVFDVSRGRTFYGPGGPYAVFAGHDASRSLACESLDGSMLKDEIDDLSTLSPSERDAMLGWKNFFYQKYDEVGWVVASEAEKRQWEEDQKVSEDKKVE